MEKNCNVVEKNIEKYDKIKLTAYGVLLTLLSFAVLNMTSWSGILVLSILLMTVGEMIGFPYSNAFAMERSKRGKKGQYMAMYIMAFSLASVFGHNGGLQLVNAVGYDQTCFYMTVLGILGVFMFIFLNQRLKKEHQ